MKQQTIETLNQINLTFYTEEAASFSATRATGWEGWLQVLNATLPDQTKVLDWGCGNGRFASLLDAKAEQLVEYWGVDNSQALLTLAETKSQLLNRIEPRFVLFDSVLGDWNTLEIPKGYFHLITVFGVLHHIPSAPLRQKVLESLAGFAKTGGLLAVSFWQFGELERFQKKAVPLEVYSNRTRKALDESDLETGDMLLSWGKDGNAVRYAHSFSDQEIDELTIPGMKAIDDFQADGKTGSLNRYVIWRKH